MMNTYKNEDVILIAEIGWSHGGDMDIAEQMIDAAAWSGATYAKFQTWSVDRLKAGEWDNDGRREIYEKAQLSKKNHIELMSYCTKKNIKFLSSVFSIPDAELLVELGVRDVKIPSFESRNKELIDYCAEHFDIVFLSTGTSTLEEIAESIKDISLSGCQLYLLHCVSTYPCEYSMANVLKINVLEAMSTRVGYSDHIEGIESAKVAIGFGAQVIEKHFTIDKNLPGRDNKFAILPDEMRQLSEYVKLRREMMIYHGAGYQEVERNQRDNYSGRFDARYEIHINSYVPCDCGNDCDMMGVDKNEPCYGQVEVVDEVEYADDSSWVHMCEGHRDVADGKNYIPKNNG